MNFPHRGLPILNKKKFFFFYLKREYTDCSMNLNSASSAQSSTQESNSGFQEYLKNLLNLKSVDEEATKQSRSLKDQIKAIKEQLKRHMEQQDIKFLPFDSQYLVLKRSPVKPTQSDEFIVAVVKKYMDASNLPFQDTDAVNFLQVLSRCRDELTTYKTELVLTNTKPIESLY